jgi:hypothetical protein
MAEGVNIYSKENVVPPSTAVVDFDSSRRLERRGVGGVSQSIIMADWNIF